MSDLQAGQSNSAIVAGASISGGSRIFGNILSAVGRKKQRKWQEKMTREQWKRDDSAVQRKVKDLEKAGLSPTLAVGGSGAMSSPVTTSGGEQGLSAAGEGMAQSNAGEVVQSAIISKRQNELLKAQTQGVSIENMQKFFSLGRTIRTGVGENEKDLFAGARRIIGTFLTKSYWDKINKKIGLYFKQNMDNIVK